MYSGEYREGRPIPFDDPERRVQGQSWTCSSRMVGENLRGTCRDSSLHIGRELLETPQEESRPSLGSDSGKTGIFWRFSLWIRISHIFCKSLKWSEVNESPSVVSDSLQPHRLYLPGSSVHGILHARILEWVAISFYFYKYPVWFCCWKMYLITWKNQLKWNMWPHCLHMPILNLRKVDNHSARQRWWYNSQESSITGGKISPLVKLSSAVHW